jgi:hypothetical protein
MKSIADNLSFDKLAHPRLIAFGLRPAPDRHSFGKLRTGLRSGAELVLSKVEGKSLVPIMQQRDSSLPTVAQHDRSAKHKRNAIALQLAQPACLFFYLRL